MNTRGFRFLNPGFRNLSLRPERPFTETESRGPPAQKSRKKSLKKGLFLCVREKLPEKSPKKLKLKIPLEIGLFGVFFDFFGYFRGLFCGPPKRLFLRLFCCDFGLGGPRDCCNRRSGRKSQVLEHFSHEVPRTFSDASVLQTRALGRGVEDRCPKVVAIVCLVSEKCKVLVFL